MVETGDRVKFKSRGLPKHNYQSPAHAEAGHEGVTWQEHFAGVKAVVVATDPVNLTAIVRGRDGDGHPFTVEIDQAHLEVTARAADGG
jgi:hypothetical protein